MKMAGQASALMSMMCMLKATENSNFPQSLSHKHKHQAKINLLHGHSQAQRPVIDVEKCPRMEYWNALLKMLFVTTVAKMDIMARCAETVLNL